MTNAAHLFDELMEMLSVELKKSDRKDQVASIIEPLVQQIILIFKEQLGHYLQIFGISFIILFVVSLINLTMLIQYTGSNNPAAVGL